MVVVKELVDNALDDAETVGIAPQIEVAMAQDAGHIRLRVADNGEGLPPEMVARTLDFRTLTSDKVLYRTPSRGQQGNALKSTLAMPYALGDKDPLVTIMARGIRHEIRLRLGAGDEIITGHVAERVEDTEGTEITVWLPEVRGYYSTKREIRRLLCGYHLFNPHASVTFSYSRPTNMVNPTGTSRPKTRKLTFRATSATKSSCRPTRSSSTGSTSATSSG
jgi:DNA topoisomerase VI subunit B